MKTFTIHLDNEQQYKHLLQLAQALGMSPVAVPMSEEDRQRHLDIIARGGSGKSIPDPVT